MFESYHDLQQHLSSEGLSELAVQSYEESDWLQAIEARYPNKIFQEKWKEMAATYTQSWRGIHSIHNELLDQPRQKAFEFLSQWAESASISHQMVSDGVIQPDALLSKSYQKMVSDLWNRYQDWLRGVRGLSDLQLLDHKLFINSYWMRSETPKYIGVKTWAYYWLQEQAPSPNDPRWHDFFLMIEETRLSNEHEPHITARSPWGRRTWACFKGIAERFQDFILLQINKKEMLIEIQQHFMQKGPKADNLGLSTIERVIADQPALLILYAQTSNYPGLTPLLSWIDTQGVAGTEFWRTLLIQAGQNALSCSDPNAGFALQSWEEMCITLAQAKQRSLVGSGTSLSQLSIEYLDDSLGALVANNGHPSALMYSIYIAALLRFSEKQHMHVQWQQIKSYRYHLKDCAIVKKRKDAYVDASQQYFLNLSEGESHIDLQILKKKLQQRADLNSLWLQGVSLGFFRNADFEKHIKILEITTLLRSFVTGNDDLLSADCWLLISQERFDQILEGLISQPHSEGFLSPAFNILDFKETDFIKGEIDVQNLGIWITQDDALTSFWLRTLSSLDWAEVAKEASEVSGLEEELFLDLQGLEKSQSWSLIALLREYFELGMPPRYQSTELEAHCLRKKNHLSQKSLLYYSHAPNPKGFIYALTPSLLDMLYSQFIKDILESQDRPRWPETLYVSLITSHSETLIHAVELIKIFEFLSKNYFYKALRGLLLVLKKSNLLLDESLQQQIAIIFSANPYVYDLAISSNLFSQPILDDLTISMLNNEEGDTIFLLEGRETNPQKLIGLSLRLIARCELNDRLAVKKVMDYIATYDWLKGEFSQTHVPYENRYPYGDMMRICMPLDARKDYFPVSTMLIKNYCNTIIPLQQMSQKEASSWLAKIQHDVCSGRLCLDFYKKLIWSVVFSKRKIFSQEVLDGDIPLHYQNYAALMATCPVGFSVEAMRKPGMKSLFARLLLAGPPADFVTERAEIEFLKNIVYEVRSFIKREDTLALLDKMLHPHYVRVLPHWLYILEIRPNQLFQYLSNDEDLLQEFLKDHIAHDLVKFLSYENYSQELVSFIVTKLVSEQAAQSLESAMENYGWAALYSDEEKSPLEDLLMQEWSPQNEQKVISWLDAGHPVERPDGLGVVELVLKNPSYHHLKDRVAVLCASQRELSQRWLQECSEECPEASFYYGRYFVNRRNLLVFSSRSAMRSSENSPKLT